MLFVVISIPYLGGKILVEDFGGGRRYGRGTRKREEGGFATVFFLALLLNSLGRLLEPAGSAYSAVHGAICLKLPSVAIFPWGVEQAVK